MVNSLILGNYGNTWAEQHKYVGQGSPLGMRDTALSLVKSRILLGDIRKWAWNAQRNGLRRKRGTKGRMKRQRDRGADCTGTWSLLSMMEYLGTVLS